MSKIKRSIKKAVALGYQKEKNSAPKVLVQVAKAKVLLKLFL